jgi:hypothetical protein
MKTPKTADAPRTFVPAPRPVTSFDEDAIASRAWRDTFAALYRSRMSCSADHAQAVACLVQPSLGTLDALIAVQTVLQEPRLSQALYEAIEKRGHDAGE